MEEISGCGRESEEAATESMERGGAEEFRGSVGTSGGEEKALSKASTHPRNSRSHMKLWSQNSMSMGSRG